MINDGEKTVDVFVFLMMYIWHRSPPLGKLGCVPIFRTFAKLIICFIYSNRTSEVIIFEKINYT